MILPQYPRLRRKPPHYPRYNVFPSSSLLLFSLPQPSCPPPACPSARIHSRSSFSFFRFLNCIISASDALASSASPPAAISSSRLCDGCGGGITWRGVVLAIEFALLARPGRGRSGWWCHHFQHRRRPGSVRRAEHSRDLAGGPVDRVGGADHLVPDLGAWQVGPGPDVSTCGSRSCGRARHLTSHLRIGSTLMPMMETGAVFRYLCSRRRICGCRPGWGRHRWSARPVSARRGCGTSAVRSAQRPEPARRGQRPRNRSERPARPALSRTRRTGRRRAARAPPAWWAQDGS